MGHFHIQRQNVRIQGVHHLFGLDGVIGRPHHVQGGIGLQDFR